MKVSPTNSAIRVHLERNRVCKPKNCPIDWRKRADAASTGAAQNIFPSQAIPVIDVKRDRDEILPEPVVALQCSQPRFRRWTAAASFRGEEFQQMRSRALTGEGQVISPRI